MYLYCVFVTFIENMSTASFFVHISVKIDANCVRDEMRRDDNESNNINIRVCDMSRCYFVYEGVSTANTSISYSIFVILGVKL